jgi:hypothetical protein
MPAIVAPFAAKAALAAPAVGAGLGSLGTGLAAGASLAGGAGLFGKLGLSTIGTGLGGAGGIGALAPAVAAKVAPAAAAQAAGTIAPSIIQSTGLEALKGKVIGAGVKQQASNLAFQQAAAKNMAGGLANPMAKAAGSQFTQVAPNLAGRDQVLQAFSRQGAGQNLTQLGPRLAGDASASSLAPQTSNLAETIRNANTTMRGNVPISYAEGAQGIAPNAFAAPTSGIQPGQSFMQNLGNFFQNPSMQGLKDYASEHPYATAGMAGLGAMGISRLMQQKRVPTPEDNSMIRPYTYERTQSPEAYATSPMMDSSERNYFNDQFIAGDPYKATERAEGGIASSYAVGGPVEQMAAMNSVGMNTGYPMAGINTPMYSNPTMQRPEATNVIAPSVGAGVDAYSGEQRFAKGGATETEGGYSYSYDPNTMQFTQLKVPTVKLPPASTMGGMSGMSQALSAIPQPVKNSGTKVSGGIAAPATGPMQVQQPTPINVPAYQTPEQQLGLDDFYTMMGQRLAGYGGYARGGNVGGEANLGDYSDGGRLLKGPGDGVSDSIPAVIGKRQPARLADGEFVIPARIVSELGNGSTEAGARKLYAMMERVQNTRKKSIGKKKVAVNSKADKHLPA